jgi:hypothetical protein
MNQIAIVNPTQKNRKEEHSKDVAIQMDNLQIDVGNSFQNKHEDNLSTKRDR